MSGPVTPEQLAQIIDRHAAALTLFAAQWTASADDCVQEALLKLVRERRCPENVLAWLYRVVRNQAISSLRAEQRRQKHESAAAFTETWFEVGAENGVDAKAVTEILRSLPKELREIVVARIWGGLSFEQIAEVVSASRSTVHRRYQEALETLRSRLDSKWLINGTN
jgi:RNA polymerase sigma-70 factor (ECF subfamily)